MRFADIVKDNGHTIVHYSKGRAGREYERVFDYVVSRRINSIDSHKYYNDYYIDVSEGE